MSYTRASFYSILSVCVASLFISFFIFGAAGETAVVFVFITAIVAVSISVLGCLCVAIPTYELFEYLNIHSSIAFALVGFMAPILLLYLLFFINSSRLEVGEAVFSLIMGAFGLLSMSVFWKCMHLKSPSKNEIITSQLEADV